jgi:hypothetical protein
MNVTGSRHCRFMTALSCIRTDWNEEGFVTITAVVIDSFTSWDVAACSSFKVDLHVTTIFRDGKSAENETKLKQEGSSVHHGSCFISNSCFDYSLIVKLVVTCYSETSANCKYLTLCYIPEAITNYLCGAEYHSRGHKLWSHSGVSQHIMEPEGSLPLSQELSNCTYPEPDQSSHYHLKLELISVNCSYYCNDGQAIIITCGFEHLPVYDFTRNGT